MEGSADPVLLLQDLRFCVLLMLGGQNDVRSPRRLLWNSQEKWGDLTLLLTCGIIYKVGIAQYGANAVKGDV
ncbi:MAG: hypothetical protein PVH17_08405, partial [Anaerolineae bacterium]|jgi:hypothetical protein